MAFEVFAFIYDEVSDHSLYERWLDFSLRHLEGRKNLLELACGTGELAIRFAQKGLQVTALDLSEEMLMIASQNALNEQAEIQFVEADMLDLADIGSYQAVTCYSDSLCYLEDEKAVQMAFDQVYQVLDDDGLFLFDVHSLYQIDEVFPGFNYHYQTDEFAFLWESYTGKQPHSIEHFLTFFIENEQENFTRKDELHLERTYPLATYQLLLENAGFSEVQIYADFVDNPPNEKSRRWFFVCHK